MQEKKTFFYTVFIIFISVMALKLGWYAKRPLPYYEADLRNKIVGARLQQDGLSPYFYHWKTGDSIRYYDCNAKPFKQNMNSSSPFQSRLLYSLANLPQKNINTIWFVVLNTFFIACLLISFLLAKTQTQQYLLLLVALLLFFSHGWKSNLKEGQVYIFIPLAGLVLFYLFYKPQTGVTGFISGVISACLVLFKLNTFLLLVPFLFTIKKFKPAFLKFYVSAIILTLGINFLQPNETALWKEYFAAVKEHISIWHQHNVPVYPDTPQLTEWEGVNPAQAKEAAIKYPLNLDKETSSFFVFYNSQFINPVSAWMVYLLFGASGAVLLFIFFNRTAKQNSFLLVETFLCGVCLYMLGDFFSPIPRFQYYSIQWLFPLLLVAAFYRRAYLIPFIFIISGLILNIISIDAVKWEHTLGEIFIFTGVFMIAANLNPYKNKLTETESL